jgi:cytochrome b pre-mRNA-processing protein 3
MLSWWRAQTRTALTASKLYGSIVTAARREAFYEGYGVPDTKEGRFAMIVVHMVLVLERLRGEGRTGEAIARALGEAFVVDMDDSMREIGIGDLSVPRQVKKAAGALYQCRREFAVALAQDGERMLAEALQSTLLPEGLSAPPVAAYMRRAAGVLAAQSGAAVLAGRVDFPAP